jgi:hypothetical protein
METIGRLRNGLQVAHWYFLWAGDWLRRHLGWGGSVGLLALVAGGVLVVLGRHFDAQAHELRLQLAEAKNSAYPRHAHTPDRAQRLRAFYDALPPATRIPRTVSELILLANDKHVALRSAEYRAQAEDAGRYLRYRISLPVVGDAQAIQGFLLAALSEYRTLALESVTFKRDRVEAREIEARIQFALITEIPTHGVVLPATNAVAAAQ